MTDTETSAENPQVQVAAPPEPIKHPLAARIEEWFTEHFANSVFSRNGEVGAAFVAAKNDLVNRLTKE